LHAAQAQAALDAGLAVFCQKPLARTASETRAVIEAAQRADRLLGVDLCYRHTAAARAVAEQVRSGALGSVYAIDLVFHNAYGPDKAWFRDPALSGGGCLIDLGTHLVDLALWVMDFPVADEASARLYAQGRRLEAAPAEVEDHALAQFTLAPGTSVRLACSWNLSAGRDAVIEAHFHGTRGSARMTNVEGSFYDFVAERCHGTQTERLAEPPDDWGGRAAVQWARAVAAGERFDTDAWQLLRVAELLDHFYGRA
uniref:Gfo/Idh/MocA family protein n=1 Tax=Pseudacidovorax intermedius TaxID=433924 RepID=UPI0005C2946F